MTREKLEKGRELSREIAIIENHIKELNELIADRRILILSSHHAYGPRMTLGPDEKDEVLNLIVEAYERKKILLEKELDEL